MITPRWHGWGGCSGGRVTVTNTPTSNYDSQRMCVYICMYVPYKNIYQNTIPRGDVQYRIHRDCRYIRFRTNAITRAAVYILFVLDCRRLLMNSTARSIYIIIYDEKKRPSDDMFIYFRYVLCVYRQRLLPARAKTAKGNCIYRYLQNLYILQGVRACGAISKEVYDARITRYKTLQV